MKGKDHHRKRLFIRIRIMKTAYMKTLNPENEWKSGVSRNLKEVIEGGEINHNS